MQCVGVCCSVLQCVAMCCSVLQCVAVCCSVLQCSFARETSYVQGTTHRFHLTAPPLNISYPSQKSPTKIGLFWYKTVRAKSGGRLIVSALERTFKYDDVLFAKEPYVNRPLFQRRVCTNLESRLIVFTLKRTLKRNDVSFAKEPYGNRPLFQERICKNLECRLIVSTLKHT